ncbi:MAG TPA: VOC family protein [Terriglobia bacterium]|nr:VOC family protein [Terriglobia bacterium]
MQMAYVVKDINDAMHWWMHNCRVGPWFLLESFTGPEQRYRGEPTSADIKLAMSFSGHMNIELIQPKDNRPSVYKETIDRRGYGFHHLGIAFADVLMERAAFEKRGYSVAFETPVPSGGSVYYLNDETREPGFIELIPATSGMDEMFTKFWKATVDWDGDEPIRPFG